jgi:hypothetical protein
MILLESTSDKIQVVTATAADVDVHASFIDYDGSTTTPGRKNTAITTATTTDVVLAPASSVHRNVKTLSFRNIDASVSQTVTVKHTDGTTAVTIVQAVLAAGEALIYLDGGDGGSWHAYDANGNLKIVSLPPFASPAIVLGSAAAGGAAQTAIRSDATLQAFDGVSPVAIAAAAATGTNAFAARSDHTHTIGAGIVTRTMEDATGKGWQFLGTATGNTTTIGPVVWSGTFQQLMIKYWIAGYNGGTPVGRILLGGASISTTGLTNSFSVSEGVTAPTTGAGATAIPGCPLAVTLSAIGRGGTIFVDGVSGGVKTLEISGRNVTPAVASIPTLFRGVSFFSDLGTNLPLQRAQLSVYDTLTAVALSAQTFTSGTYLTVWGRNND